MSAKLTIRDWQKGDVAKIGELHAKMAPGYVFPADFSPLFCVRKAVVEENGQIVAAAAVKLVSEAFLWVDSEVSALNRARALKMLSAECSREAKRLGLEEVSCWVPPQLVGCFTKLLEKLGWRKSPWSNWSFVVK